LEERGEVAFGNLEGMVQEGNITIKKRARRIRKGKAV
jgi:hypothetical protein